MSRASQPTQFTENVYQLLRQVPTGRVTTYQALAEAAGTRAYRAVGQAMRRNPDTQRTPCHRVVASDGSLGGYAGGPKRKIACLRAEGVLVQAGRIINFRDRLYSDFR